MTSLGDPATLVGCGTLQLHCSYTHSDHRPTVQSYLRLPNAVFLDPDAMYVIYKLDEGW